MKGSEKMNEYMYKYQLEVERKCIVDILAQYDEFGKVFDEAELPELAKEVFDTFAEILTERDKYKDCLEFTKKFITDEANETIWISSGETLYERIDTVLANDEQGELI